MGSNEMIQAPIFGVSLHLTAFDEGKNDDFRNCLLIIFLVWFGLYICPAKLIWKCLAKQKLGMRDVVLVDYMGIDRKRFSNCSSRSISASNDNFSP